ncbi:MAG: T9SS type A sorting domain-containing protein, partial [Bacteroidota bacterium]
TYPIELVGFEVKKEDNSVQVIWSTATEINNDYFTIERAAGNQDFKAIGTVQGAGNSNQTLNYSYTDNDAPNGEQLYYRIKQTDYDGSYSYSWIQNVNIENNVTVNVYPNPVQRGQNIMIQSSEDNLLLNLYDAQGNKVRSSNLNHNQNKIETSDLNPGLYFIRLQNSYDETTVTRKLIIQ